MLVTVLRLFAIGTIASQATWTNSVFASSLWRRPSTSYNHNRQLPPTSLTPEATARMPLVAPPPDTFTLIPRFSSNAFAAAWI